MRNPFAMILRNVCAMKIRWGKRRSVAGPSRYAYPSTTYRSSNSRQGLPVTGNLTAKSVFERYGLVSLVDVIPMEDLRELEHFTIQEFQKLYRFFLGRKDKKKNISKKSWLVMTIVLMFDWIVDSMTKITTFANDWDVQMEGGFQSFNHYWERIVLSFDVDVSYHCPEQVSNTGIPMGSMSELRPHGITLMVRLLFMLSVCLCH